MGSLVYNSNQINYPPPAKLVCQYQRYQTTLNWDLGILWSIVMLMFCVSQFYNSCGIILELGAHAKKLGGVWECTLFRQRSWRPGTKVKSTPNCFGVSEHNSFFVLLRTSSDRLIRFYNQGGVGTCARHIMCAKTLACDKKTINIAFRLILRGEKKCGTYTAATTIQIKGINHRYIYE